MKILNRAKISVVLAVIFMGLQSQAAQKSWTFTFKPKAGSALKLNLSADNKEAAYKLATKECFQKLTNGVYPGEEKGLEYIDVCANPKM